jgi:hypothetical protein
MDQIANLFVMGLVLLVASRVVPRWGAAWAIRKHNKKERERGRSIN